MKTLSLIILSISLGIGQLFTAVSHAENNPAKKLNFVVSLPAPPSRIFKVWSPLVDYLESKTGYKVNLLTPKGLDNLEQLLVNEQVDFIYLNSYAYFLMKEKGLLDAIVQMRNKEGSITSRGRVLVRNDSGISKLEDLRGGTVSLISPNGAGSYLAPKAFFAEKGMELAKDIKVSYSGDLKKSVYDVLLKEASAAVMCGVNYDIIKKKIDMQDIFVLELTDSFPEAVIAVAATMDKNLKQSLSNILINMSTSYGGRSALIKLRNTKIHDFVAYDTAIEKHTTNLIARSKTVSH